MFYFSYYPVLDLLTTFLLEKNHLWRFMATATPLKEFLYLPVRLDARPSL